MSVPPPSCLKLYVFMKIFRFLKGGKIGDDLLIDVKTVRCGKTLAFLDVFIKNKATGDLLVKGSHTKYILPQQK